MIFIDFKKSFDKVGRIIQFEILWNDKVQNQLTKADYNIYKKNLIATLFGT